MRLIYIGLCNPFLTQRHLTTSTVIPCTSTMYLDGIGSIVLVDERGTAAFFDVLQRLYTIQGC